MLRATYFLKNNPKFLIYLYILIQYTTIQDNTIYFHSTHSKLWHSLQIMALTPNNGTHSKIMALTPKSSSENEGIRFLFSVFNRWGKGPEGKKGEKYQI